MTPSAKSSTQPDNLCAGQNLTPSTNCAGTATMSSWSSPTSARRATSPCTFPNPESHGSAAPPAPSPPTSPLRCANIKSTASSGEARFSPAPPDGPPPSDSLPAIPPGSETSRPPSSPDAPSKAASPPSTELQEKSQMPRRRGRAPRRKRPCRRSAADLTLPRSGLKTRVRRCPQPACALLAANQGRLNPKLNGVNQTLRQDGLLQGATTIMNRLQNGIPDGRVPKTG